MPPHSESAPEVVQILTIKVVLKRSRPPNWQRIAMPDHACLADLHDVLQVCIGWEDYYLHKFQLGHAKRHETSLEDPLAQEIEEEEPHSRTSCSAGESSASSATTSETNGFTT